MICLQLESRVFYLCLVWLRGSGRVVDEFGLCGRVRCAWTASERHTTDHSLVHL